MIFEAIGVLVLLGGIAAGAAMLARALLRAPAVSAVQCGRCGQPAESLTSFTCPGCGQDVRDAGLQAIVASSAVARFAKTIVFTLVLLLVGSTAFHTLYNLVPSTRYIQIERNLHPTFGGFESIDVDCRLKQAGTTMHGKMVADLVMLDGRMTTLQVEFPSRKCWMIDEHGRRNDLGAFDEGSMRQWLRNSGVDDTDYNVGAGVDNAYTELRYIADGVNADLYRGSLPKFSGGGGSSSRRVAAAWFGPAMLIFWTTLWLLGFRWLLRDCKPAARPAITEAAA